jgi:hypothetical protein
MMMKQTLWNFVDYEQKFRRSYRLGHQAPAEKISVYLEGKL